MKRFVHYSLTALITVGSVLGQVPSATLVEPPSDSFEIGLNRAFAAFRESVETQPTTSGSRETRRIVSDLAEVLSLIRSRHVHGDHVEGAPLSKSAILGALRSLDPHSNFFDAVEHKDLLEEQRSEYSGIGVTIASHRRDGRWEMYIVSTVPGSPAAVAKLGYGDRIVKLNNESIDGRSADDVRDIIRGESGTQVSVVVEKASTGKLVSLDIRRRTLPQPSIRNAFVLPGGHGYIQLLDGFNNSTSDELSAELRKLRRLRVKGLVLDLRDNPGGLLEQAVRVAEKFLPFGSLIVSQRGRGRLDNRMWRSTNRAPETLPFVLLVNENSASASEIVAGALQDHDRALIVGEKTFGKGLVQTLFDSPSGTALSLTTARYYTPSGRSIQRDYSSVDVYEYFNHRLSDQVNSRLAARTSKNRIVFGGDGIEPDEKSESARLHQVQRQLLDPLFFFALHILYGNTNVSSEHDQGRVSDSLTNPLSSFSDERLFDEFVEFASPQIRDRISIEQLRSEKEFIVRQMRYNLELALKGESEADRSLLLKDPAILKAVEHFPRAKELARAIKPTRQQ